MPAALLAGESWDTRDFDQRDNGCVEACGVFDPIRFSSGFNAVEQNKDTDIASEYVKWTQVIVNELLKGVLGLEVFHNGKWVVMSGVPNAFLVLNADHLE
ncbi:hypothetical protein Tco_0128723, partial [Tanacetum coccineum]